MSVVSKTFPYGSNTVTIETGEMARQAGGDCLNARGAVPDQFTECQNMGVAEMDDAAVRVEGGRDQTLSAEHSRGAEARLQRLQMTDPIQ